MVHEIDEIEKCFVNQSGVAKGEVLSDQDYSLVSVLVRATGENELLNAPGELMSLGVYEQSLICSNCLGCVSKF